MDSLFNMFAYRTQKCDDIVDELEEDIRKNGRITIEVVCDEDLTQEELEYIKYQLEEKFLI